MICLKTQCPASHRVGPPGQVAQIGDLTNRWVNYYGCNVSQGCRNSFWMYSYIHFLFNQGYIDHASHTGPKIHSKRPKAPKTTLSVRWSRCSVNLLRNVCRNTSAGGFGSYSSNNTIPITLSGLSNPQNHFSAYWPATCSGGAHAFSVYEIDFFGFEADHAFGNVISGHTN